MAPISFANAFSIWTLDNLKINLKSPAHIVVVGYSHGVSDLFVRSATARMLRYRDLFPDETIVLYQPTESYPLPGLKKISDNKTPLLGESLVHEMLGFERIRSIDFFSHSSAHQGVGLETGSVTMPYQSFYAVGLPDNPVVKYRSGTPGIAELKSHLTDDAYITLNGCNAAWLQAPALSRLVERPVLAAATSTDFEQLFSDGAYYFNNKGEYPGSGSWAARNDQSFTLSLSCATGACNRMNPAPVAYLGFWGDYTNVGGLGFYKFFCNYNGYEKNCFKTMANYLRATITTHHLTRTSARAEYLRAVYDLVCPISPKTPATRADCISNIENKLARGEENYNPYNEIPADCDLKGCKIKSLHCDLNTNGWATPRTCKFTKDPAADGTKTLIREVKNYLRGFDELGIH